MKEQQAITACESMWETLSRNEYFKDVIRRLREIKKKKKKC